MLNLSRNDMRIEKSDELFYNYLFRKFNCGRFYGNIYLFLILSIKSLSQFNSQIIISFESCTEKHFNPYVLLLFI